MAIHNLYIGAIAYDDVKGEITVTAEGGQRLSGPSHIPADNFSPLGPSMSVNFVVSVKAKSVATQKGISTAEDENGFIVYTLWEKLPTETIWTERGPCDSAGNLLPTTPA